MEKSAPSQTNDEKQLTAARKPSARKAKAANGIAKKGAETAQDGAPKPILEADILFEASIEADLSVSTPGMGMEELDDLDMAERFDLGDTAKTRNHSRADASIVAELDEIYDNLALSDADEMEEAAPAKGKRGGKRNGKAQPPAALAAPAVAEEEEVAEGSEAEEPEEAATEDSEPDASALAHAAEIFEAAQHEDLEKAIDRALHMVSEGSIDDPVRIYLREIGRTALLKSPDESALALRMAAGRKAQEEIDAILETVRHQAQPDAPLEEGDDIVAGVGELSAEQREQVLKLDLIVDDGARAKDVLVQANLRLVVSIARRYIGRGLSLLDLIQEGNIGLMKAADKFDYSKGFKFSTYATWWIRQAITRAISDQSRTIRLPVHVTEMVTRLRRAAHELQQELLREPTEEELGQKLNMPPERVRKMLDMARHPASLDAPMEEGEDNFLGDFIEDERTATPMEEASRQMLKEQVDDILSKLSERERNILQMRYGLTDDRPRTLEEVAKAFGITRERIRQIETRILRKLRYARFGANKLRGYLD